MAITIPNVFVAGTRIESAPVNANFAAMSNALDKTGDTLTGNLVVGTGITIDGLDISTVPQSGGTFNPNGIVFTNIILGAATTAGIRLDLESGTLAVREGDDSAYGPMLASVYNVPTGGSINFNAGSAALTWDTTESTANLALSASVDHKIGTQELVRCTNRTGTAIAKGKAVYIVGAHGNRPEIALADASTEATAATTLGITAESIADTGEGFVCVTGMLRGLNTNHLTEGQIVWLSETAGELTSTRPTQPAHGVFMGLCVRQQPGTSGILYISVVNGMELEELHDVLITTPTANQILKRNSGNTLWVNSSGTALTKTDDTNVTLTLGGSASTALVNAASLTLGWTGQLALTRGGTGASTAQGAMDALAGATTSGQYLRGNGTNVVMSAIQAGDVPTLNQNTTGTAAGLSATLAVSSGGTGQTSYTDGQLLIGNTATTSLSKATLTAGSGVTITNGNGSITIAATGSGGTVTSVGATSPVASSGGTTPTISLNSAYGDTLNPYGSKTANFVLAAPDGGAGTPSFRALVAADIPTLNQNTTGTAAGLSATLAVASGGTGQTTYTDGQLLIGNTTGNTLTKATLTAGSGISITNGGGSITIAATGGGGSGTVTSVSGTGTVNGLTLSGTVTTTGDLTLSGTVDSMSALAGSASAPSIAASGDTNTGVYFPAADTVAATTGGTERLRITSGGFVGIGTESPSASLEIASNTDGNMYIGRYTADAFSPSLVVRKARGTVASPAAIATNDFLGSYLFQGFGGTNWRSLAQIYAYASNYTSDTNITSYLGFLTTNAGSSSTERFRIAGNGDVSISATAKLFLDGVGGGDTYLTESAANTISVFTGGTERARITGNGRVLINTSTEHMGVPLNVIRGVGVVNFSDAVAPEIYIRRARSTESSPTALQTNDTIGSIIFQGYGGANNRSLASISPVLTTYTSDTDMTAALRFYVTNASTVNVERFRISGPGDIAIGSGAKLLLDSVGAAGDTYLTETSANQIAIFTGGNERLRLDGSGNVGVNVTTFGTSAAGVLGLKNGTEPSSGPSDTVQIYSVDRSAGNTIPAIYTEGSGVTNAGITSTTVTHKIALKVNGTVYYLLATTNAT